MAQSGASDFNKNMKINGSNESNSKKIHNFFNFFISTNTQPSSHSIPQLNIYFYYGLFKHTKAIMACR